jgi:dTDP-4-amino-4,6-dideoxygalactose transaminase
VTTLAARAGSVPAAHLYPVRTARRDALRSGLEVRGIETAIHYPEPLHLQPAYAFLGGREGDFTVSEAACRTVLSLPLHPALSDADAGAVAGAVREVLAGT